MEIKGTVTYTAKLLRKFNLFHMLKNRGLMVFYAVLEALLILLFIGLFATGAAADSFPFVIFCGVMIAVLPVTVFLTPLLTAALNKNILGLENQFTFTEQGVRVVSTGPAMQSQAEMEYKMICKAYETKDSFYIYLTKLQAYPLPKNNIEENKVDDLRRLLAEKLPEGKFIAAKLVLK